MSIGGIDPESVNGEEDREFSLVFASKYSVELLTRRFASAVKSEPRACICLETGFLCSSISEYLLPTVGVSSGDMDCRSFETEIADDTISPVPV
jgi:hypothetical protein